MPSLRSAARFARVFVAARSALSRLRRRPSVDLLWTRSTSTGPRGARNATSTDSAAPTTHGHAHDEPAFDGPRGSYEAITFEKQGGVGRMTAYLEVIYSASELPVPALPAP